MKTEYCGLINSFFLKKFINIYGWVNNIRNHGNIIFIDLRDKKGIVQLICFKKKKKIFNKIVNINNEYCLNIIGFVKNRLKNNINLNLITGIIEINILNIKILNPCKYLPFKLDETNISEKLRLKYRILDLRRDFMQKNLKLRYKIVKNIRKFLDKNNFIEIETPFLSKNTSEGARNYLIPSRLNKKFFALPQSPQLFKQLLMISGFDRYYQITKCFRDEDLRADRQSEFTQIDCEVSFFKKSEICNFFENMISDVIFKKIFKINLPDPFPVLNFDKSIKKYRTDKPDLRVKLKFIDITNKIKIFLKKNIFFLKFLNINKFIDIKSVILKIPKGNFILKKKIFEYNNFLKNNNINNFYWIKKKNYNSFFLKKILNKKINFIKKNDIIFIAFSKNKKFNYIMSQLRLKIGYSKFGIKNNLFFKNKFCPVWIKNFPIFKYNNKKKTWSTLHHPFILPKNGHEKLLLKNPLKAYSQSYDLVLNGSEIGGGSLRAHKFKIQKNIFKILNINKKNKNLKKEFKFLLKSLKFGAPPHGGIAFGLDRLLSVILNLKSIRDIIAFPKTKNNECLLTNVPTKIKSKKIKKLYNFIL